jgi:hypothetical protein
MKRMSQAVEGEPLLDHEALQAHQEMQALEVSPEAVSPLSGGGVELTTNAIQGTIRYTNQNSEILAFLAEDSWRYFSSISANSTSPAGYSASTSSSTFVNPREYTFEMIVEAGAGGANGVVYSLSALRGPYPWANQWTASGVTVRHRNIQPEPTRVTMELCAGAVRFVGGTDETCATPMPLRSLSTNGYFATYAKQGQHIGYVQPGFNQNVGVSYSMSTSNGVLSGSRTVPLRVACDEVVTVCLPQPPPPPPPPPTGSLTGPWEIIGETAVGQYTQIWGPAFQSRWDATPLAPVSDPSTWWTLEDLPAGNNYYMRSYVYLRSGRDAMEAWTPYVDGLTVVANQTTPVTRQVEGETRYPFVMQPSYVYGSVRLVDPYVANHPGARSALQALYFGDWDHSGDGFPDCLGCGTRLYSYASAWGGGVYGAFRDRFDSSTGQLSSNYEHALLSPFNLPLTWYQYALELRFSASSGDSQPANHYQGNFALQQTRSSARLEPGERFRVDHEYCFNDVLLEYWTTQGRFYLPSASVSGSFTGNDWRGQPASYNAWGSFSGTPAQHSNASPRGTINLTLPQGTYTLRPSAYMINSAGQVNHATFAPISMQLGCGQRVKIVPPLTVTMSPMQGCAQSGSQRVTGVVRSSPAEVDRIWYRLNGGPEVTLCENCGRDPSFDFTVALQACGNSIEVFGFTEGMPEPAVGYQQLVWDDPADGPSCAGSYCVNQPPVARCRSVTLALGPTCGGGDASIDDGSFDPDTGDTITCVQSPEGPYGEGSRRVRLTCTDSTGLSSWCEATVSVRDMTPPVVTCPSSTEQQCSASVTSGTGATATDNCTAEPVVNCVEGAPGPTGTPVTCTATDAAGNRASCSYMAASDTEPPRVVCPDAVVVCGSNGHVSPYTPAVTDNCGGDVSVSCTPAPGAPLPEGTTEASCTATDSAGNQASCSAPVRNIPEGELALTLLGAQEMTLECGVDTWVDPGAVATEWCSMVEVHRYNTGDDDRDGVPGSQDPDDYGPGPDTSAEGSYSVQYIAWNEAGTTVRAIRTVHVNDSRAPTLSLRGPAQMTHTCGSPWVDPGVEAMDACYGDVSPTVVPSGYVNGWVPGTYTVTYTLTDSGGNSAPPVTRTVNVANCPWGG